MDTKGNSELVPRARELRKNMTPEERRLWYNYLKSHPARFTRQRILGQYIADFYSARAHLVVEIDGSQHYEDKGLARDEERTKYLNRFGIDVIRVPNNEVRENFESVCLYINAEVAKRTHIPETSEGEF